MSTAIDIVLVYVALYPVITAAVWLAGGILFHVLEERRTPTAPPEGWPGVTMLIPAYNEERVIDASVRAALACDYPDLELLVLDDGSLDRTVQVARAAAAGDPRCEVVRDPVNRGKADRLNRGFVRARHPLVVVADADARIQSDAIKLLVARMVGSDRIAAVAGAPHVTNRINLLCAMQVLEAPSVIGLIRRTQALTGRVGTVAGVLGLFRRERVLAVGGYDPGVATEDIDLTWRLLIAGWHTAYEPRALIGMEVPSHVRALWAQRKRWARGQGEVLHKHLRSVRRWGNHRMWFLGLESVGSLVWVVSLAVSVPFTVVHILDGGGRHALGIALAWGILVAMIGTLQLGVGLWLDRAYDRRAGRAFLVGPLYPAAYWLLSACAALRCQVVGLVQGPRRRSVVWDIPRD